MGCVFIIQNNKLFRTVQWLVSFYHDCKMDKSDFVDVDLPFPPREKYLENSDKLTKTVVTTNITNYFREYCNCTSIHGFRYFGEKRTTFEKIWWAFVFTFCLIICIFSIVTVYRKWDSSPVIVSFATRGKPIYDIPFPAVTICSESKIRRNVFDYTQALLKKKKGENLSEHDETYLSFSNFICNYQENFDYSSLNASSVFNFIDVLEKVSPQFSIINCKYLGRQFDCNKFFIPVITDEGSCYTFNMIDRTELFSEKVIHHSNYLNVKEQSSNWSIEQGYSETAEIEAYPKRALLAGAKNGLRFVLKIAKERSDKTCRDSILGYRALFHAPVRYPRLSQQFLRVPLNRAFAAAIRPSQIMTSEAVKNYPAEKRRCYFPSERRLKYFEVYSQSNCNVECLTDVILKECGCVLFFMPRENGTRICSNGVDYECSQKAEHNLQILGLQNTILKRKKSLKIERKACDCLPMCTDIDYKIGISQSDWNWSDEITSPDNNLSNYHLSKVTAYFISGSFIGSERNELYGPIDFLANFGGLLGLFTGFSVLSLMEIIYFLTIRLLCNVRLYGYWTGPQDNN